MREAKVKDSLTRLKASGIPINEIVDIGIQHATPVLIELFPDRHHYLFEPISEYFPFIREHYEGISNDLIEAAVCDYDGELVLHTEKKTRGDEISHSYLVGQATDTSRKTRALRLDTFFATRNTEDCFLKIDVEGADVPGRILLGAGELLTRTTVVMIEMTVDKFMERAIQLHQAGFDIWDICDLCYYGDCLWQADVIFVRRDLKASFCALAPMHDGQFDPDLWQSGF